MNKHESITVSHQGKTITLFIVVGVSDHTTFNPKPSVTAEIQDVKWFSICDPKALLVNAFLGGSKKSAAAMFSEIQKIFEQEGGSLKGENYEHRIQFLTNLMRTSFIQLTEWAQRKQKTLSRDISTVSDEISDNILIDGITLTNVYKSKLGEFVQNLQRLSIYVIVSLALDSFEKIYQYLPALCKLCDTFAYQQSGRVKPWPNNLDHVKIPSKLLKLLRKNKKTSFLVTSLNVDGSESDTNEGGEVANFDLIQDLLDNGDQSSLSGSNPSDINSGYGPNYRPLPFPGLTPTTASSVAPSTSTMTSIPPAQPFSTSTMLPSFYPGFLPPYPNMMPLVNPSTGVFTQNYSNYAMYSNASEAGYPLGMPINYPYNLQNCYPSATTPLSLATNQNRSINNEPYTNLISPAPLGNNSNVIPPRRQQYNKIKQSAKQQLSYPTTSPDTNKQNTHPPQMSDQAMMPLPSLPINNIAQSVNFSQLYDESTSSTSTNISNPESIQSSISSHNTNTHQSFSIQSNISDHPPKSQKKISSVHSGYESDNSLVQPTSTYQRSSSRRLGRERSSLQMSVKDNLNNTNSITRSSSQSVSPSSNKKELDTDNLHSTIDASHDTIATLNLKMKNVAIHETSKPQSAQAQTPTKPKKISKVRILKREGGTPLSQAETSNKITPNMTSLSLVETTINGGSIIAGNSLAKANSESKTQSSNNKELIDDSDFSSEGSEVSTLSTVSLPTSTSSTQTQRAAGKPVPKTISIKKNSVQLVDGNMVQIINGKKVVLKKVKKAKATAKTDA